MADLDILRSEQIITPAVKLLEKFPIVDDVPNIQFTPLSIDFETSSLSNPVAYADHVSFRTQFGVEIEQMAKIDGVLEHGQHYVHMLYTFRSVSKAIPQLVGDVEINFMFSIVFIMIFFVAAANQYPT